MLTEERQQKILQLLDQQNIVKLHDLIEELGASESTIRRDLQELENRNLLERIHGGAKKIQQLGYEADMVTKSQENIEAKQAIAQYAASLVHQDEVIYLDAGSTTLEMINYLSSDLKLIVVTNSVKHAAALIDRQIETIILGGTIKLSTNATHGYNSIQLLEQFRFNKVFMGMNGIDQKGGYTTPDPEEAVLKRMAIRQSEEAFILADHSKFNVITFTRVAALEEATVITDHCPADHLAAYQALTKIKEVNQ